MRANAKRIIETIDLISTYNRTPGEGCTRPSFSDEDLALKKRLTKEFDTLGMITRVDNAGNVRSVLEGINPTMPRIMIGSHIDTVTNGGTYDGVLGVVCALETIRVFKENNILPNISIELVIFSDEEGSAFNSLMLGSESLVDKLTVDDIKNIYDEENRSCYDVLKSIGVNPDDISDNVIKENEVKAMLEIHIEQSVVLDNLNIPIGVVSAIAGMKTLKIDIVGKANHAGATPMNMRSNALLEASKLVQEIDDIAKNADSKDSVATVGTLNVYPNSSNVIPEHVELYVDVRDGSFEGIDEITKKIEKYVESQKEEKEFKYTLIEVSKSDAIKLSKQVIDLIEESARENGTEYKIMNSGAVHDAAHLAKVTDVGMIFVPSVGGDSHCPEEFTNIDDIVKGCDIFIDVVYKLAK